MKLCVVLSVILFCVSQCEAQAVPNQSDSPTGLVVLKVKYERHREDRDVRSTSSDPGALENTGIMPTGKTPTIYVYEYSVQVRNDSGKNIKWLYWAHIISNADSKAQLDRQEFISFDKISANQKETLLGRKRFSHAADYEASKKGPRLEEAVEFMCVGYGDGSLWHAISISESDCRDAEKRRKPR
jgi:hypothetical protein